jgi:hypothetical protein
MSCHHNRLRQRLLFFFEGLESEFRPIERSAEALWCKTRLVPNGKGATFYKIDRS